MHAAARAARSQAEQERLAAGLRDQLLALPELAMASTVAAYVSQDGEPGTAPLIDALDAAAVTVIVPILRDDFDLDWGTYALGALEPGRFGLLVPTTRPLGVDAIARADVVVCPGVAVDRSGNRLGRGGGSFDRALARCDDDRLRVQLAYDDEVVDEIPTDPHDQPVHVIVTPTTTIRVSRPAPG
jgi:5-formyltetrahydrofolate cyclo-ligase